MAEDTALLDPEVDSDEAEEEEKAQKSNQKKKGPSTEKKVLQRLGGGICGCLGGSMAIVFALTIVIAVGYALINPATSGGSTGSAGGATCDTPSACAVSGNIVATAKLLAWPTYGHGDLKADATPAYQAAVAKYEGYTTDTSSYPFSDCGVFVSVVMQASGVDHNYPKSGVSTQYAYASSHPNLYKIITLPDRGANSSMLQVGDIMMSNDHASHTYIYAANLGFTGYNSIAASEFGHVPEADTWDPTQTAEGSLMHTVVRYIGPAH